jgi:hypothetical protein
LPVAAPLPGQKRGLLVLGHGWIMEVSKSNQAPTMTEHTNDILEKEKRIAEIMGKIRKLLAK